MTKESYNFGVDTEAKRLYTETSGMTAKRFNDVEIIYTPHLPVEILNEKTNEKEVFHMRQKGNTIFVSEELYKSLDKRYGNG